METELEQEYQHKWKQSARQAVRDQVLHQQQLEQNLQLGRLELQYMSNHHHWKQELGPRPAYTPWPYVPADDSGGTNQTVGRTGPDDQTRDT